MQSLLLFAPLVRRENDPLTSLSAALALLLMHNPHAAAGAGLQLSFASLAGILCFTERMERAVYARPPPCGHKAGRAVSAVVNSLSVLLNTVPLMLAYISAPLPLLAPLANLLVLWLVSLCFCGAYLACAAGLLFTPLGSLAGSVLAWGLRAILFASHAVAAVPFAAVYLESREVLLWLALCYALFLGFRLARGGAAAPGPARPALARKSGAAAHADAAGLRRGHGDHCRPGRGAGPMSGRALRGCDAADRLRRSQHDRQRRETAGALPARRGRGGVDTLMLTHLDADHCNGVATLLAMCPVRQLLLPAEPRTDNSMLAEIERAAARRGTAAAPRRDRSAALRARQGAAPTSAVSRRSISLGGYDMLVTGDINKAAERSCLRGTICGTSSC